LLFIKWFSDTYIYHIRIVRFKYSLTYLQSDIRNWKNPKVRRYFVKRAAKTGVHSYRLVGRTVTPSRSPNVRTRIARSPEQQRTARGGGAVTVMKCVEGVRRKNVFVVATCDRSHDVILPLIVWVDVFFCPFSSKANLIAKNDVRPADKLNTKTCSVDVPLLDLVSVRFVTSRGLVGVGHVTPTRNLVVRRAPDRRHLAIVILLLLSRRHFINSRAFGRPDLWRQNTVVWCSGDRRRSVRILFSEFMPNMACYLLVVTSKTTSFSQRTDNGRVFTRRQSFVGSKNCLMRWNVLIFAYHGFFRQWSIYFVSLYYDF